MKINISNGQLSAIAENDKEANQLLALANIRPIPVREEVGLISKRVYNKTEKYSKKDKMPKVHCEICNAFVVKKIGLKTHMYLKHGILHGQPTTNNHNNVSFENNSAYDTENLSIL